VTEASPALERAAPSHLDAILAIAVDSFASPWSRAGHAEELERPDGICWIAREQGELAGYLLARAQGDDLHVLSIAVAPARRRRGIAAALLERALGDPRASEATAAHLEVRATAAPALGCYAAAGFEVVGRRAAYYPGGVDAILMSRPLSREVA
jgi:ribosomal-protein-alanine N-acetyltransferase